MPQRLVEMLHSYCKAYISKAEKDIELIKRHRIYENNHNYSEQWSNKFWINWVKNQ